MEAMRVHLARQPVGKVWQESVRKHVHSTSSNGSLGIKELQTKCVNLYTCVEEGHQNMD